MPRLRSRTNQQSDHSEEDQEEIPSTSKCRKQRKKSIVKPDAESSSSDQEITPRKTRKIDVTPKTRSSERIKKIRNREFHMPSLEEVLGKIHSGVSPRKIPHLKPRKLVNNFTRVTHRYNYDPDYTDEDSLVDDFIQTSEEDSESEAEESQSQGSKKSGKKGTKGNMRQISSESDNENAKSSSDEETVKKKKLQTSVIKSSSSEDDDQITSTQRRRTVSTRIVSESSESEDVPLSRLISESSLKPPVEKNTGISRCDTFAENSQSDNEVDVSPRVRGRNKSVIASDSSDADDANSEKNECQSNVCDSNNDQSTKINDVTSSQGFDISHLNKSSINTDDKVAVKTEPSRLNEKVDYFTFDSPEACDAELLQAMFEYEIAIGLHVPIKCEPLETTCDTEIMQADTLYTDIKPKVEMLNSDGQFAFSNGNSFGESNSSSSQYLNDPSQSNDNIRKSHISHSDNKENVPFLPRHKLEQDQFETTSTCSESGSNICDSDADCDTNSGLEISGSNSEKETDVSSSSDDEDDLVTTRMRHLASRSKKRIKKKDGVLKKFQLLKNARMKKLAKTPDKK